MLAIPISKDPLIAKMFSAGRIGAFRHCIRFSERALFVMALFASINLFAADTNQITASPASLNADRASRARAALEQARSLYESGSNHVEASWQFARACFDTASVTSKNAERAAIAEQGIAASREALKQATNVAAVHYYLGMDLGQLADTKRNLAGLRIVKEMEREFEAARNLDEKFDNAGPDRNLGLLYEQAPAIISIGSRSKARLHLRQAVELAPAYPENGLNLIEGYLKWGDYSDARHELDAMQKSWSESQKQFNSDTWTASWSDWEKRLAKAREKLEAERY